MGTGIFFEVVEAVIIVIAIIMANLVIIGIANIIADTMEARMIQQMVTLPNFGHTHEIWGKGNTMFDVYSNLRWATTILLTIGAISLVLAGRITTNPALGKMAANCIIIILVLTFFPYLWDMGTSMMSDMSLFVLNQDYSFDSKNPCRDTLGNDEIIAKYEHTPYIKESQKQKPESSIMDVCMPEMKARYIISQIIDDQEYDLGISDPLGAFFHSLAHSISSMTATVFLGFLKGFAVIGIALTAMLLAVLADMMTGMVIVALPILLTIRMFPPLRRIADVFITSIPALFLIPLMSSIVLTVGAAAVASIGGGPGDGGVLHVWATSLGVLLFTAALPMLFVPLIRGVFVQAQSIITHAVSASGIVVASMGIGAAKGMTNSGNAKIILKDMGNEVMGNISPNRT